MNCHEYQTSYRVAFEWIVQLLMNIKLLHSNITWIKQNQKKKIMKIKPTMPLLRFLSIKQNACGGFSFYRKTITLHYKMLLEKSLRWNHRADPEFSLLTRPSSLADTPTIHTVVFSHSLLLIEGTKERHTTSINGEECGQVSILKKLGKAERQICKSFP